MYSNAAFARRAILYGLFRFAYWMNAVAIMVLGLSVWAQVFFFHDWEFLFGSMAIGTVNVIVHLELREWAR